MALIPGTLPNDTCYGTPQDLLELFAQYLDVPAFALNSKVVFGTSSAGLTADVVWFDTTTATNPIMKITVSGGFVDYIKNYITNAPVVTIVGADSVLILDASDSGNTKRGLVSDIVPAAGSITPAQLAQPFTSGTAVASTSGTAIDFTGLPSWAKRVTVIFDGVSLSTTSTFLFQVGSGSFATTGYNSGATSVSVSVINTTNGAGANTTNGISSGGYTGTAASTAYGHVIFTKITGNTWVASGVLYVNDALRVVTFGGGVNLSGVLDRVRITTANGTDTFDAGTINIMYE